MEPVNSGHKGAMGPDGGERRMHVRPQGVLVGLVQRSLVLGINKTSL